MLQLRMLVKGKRFIGSAISTFEPIAFFKVPKWKDFLSKRRSAEGIQMHDYQFIQKKHTGL
jgi:hypothetical protein